MPGPTVGRIRERALFGMLAGSSLRGRSGPIGATYVRPPSTPPFPLVGYAVGRRCGSAVRRNRLRRRLRAVVAEAASELPPGAYLVSSGPEAAELSHRELAEAVRRAMTTAAGAAEAGAQ